MSLIQGILAELKADGSIDTLVGDRIYYDVAGNSVAFPFIVFVRTGLQSTQTLDGVDTLRKVTVELSIYSEKVLEAETLTGHVRRVMDGKRATLGAQVIAHCFLVTQQDLSQIESDGTIRRTSLTFEIMMHED